MQAEVNALTMQTMMRLKRGDTLPTSGIYKRMMVMLRERADKLLPNPQLPLRDVNDWLAIALFAEDRRQFVALCQEANDLDDSIYRRAEPWLRRIVESDLNGLNADSGS